MWENFQKVLEKRVNKKTTIKDDKYLIINASKKVLVRFFGEISEEFIEIKDYKNKSLYLNFQNSTWRSEFKLNQREIVDKINKKLGEKLIEQIILI